MNIHVRRWEFYKGISISVLFLYILEPHFATHYGVVHSTLLGVLYRHQERLFNFFLYMEYCN